ncbi:VOC family protein [Stappia indica]|uniref:VOC family protein n=1 Tax=Stappia indica TaxID=538381 RepID=UPI001CD435E9|nr:VOC family protein [Stappia indica]MCA1298674.1 VOC family protein [Stappia indica]
MRIMALDHIVLTVTDMDAAVRFYCEVLGMEEVVFGGGRRALRFGSQKINLHPPGHDYAPVAERPAPGSADLCFLVASLDAAIAALEAAGVGIEEGPVSRTGALSPLRSIYIRDPEGNLVELSEPQNVVLAGSGDRG